MPNPAPNPTPEDLILAMLRDVLARQAQQMGLPTPAAAAPPAPGQPPVPAPPTPPPVAPAAETRPVAAQPAAPTMPGPRLTKGEQAALARFESRAAEAPPPSQLNGIVRAVVVGVLLFLLLINLPLVGGTAVARALPDRQSLIVRDGLVLKASGPEIYVLEDNQKRWISSLDAFAHFGYTWDQVRVVDDAFLAEFPEGRPLHVLAKCPNSPHVYRLENDVKRWIVDIPALLAEGHVWEDVRPVDCRWLRSLPDGETIPPGAGPPPEP